MTRFAKADGNGPANSNYQEQKNVGSESISFFIDKTTDITGDITVAFFDCCGMTDGRQYHRRIVQRTQGLSHLRPSENHHTHR